MHFHVYGFVSGRRYCILVSRLHWFNQYYVRFLCILWFLFNISYYFALLILILVKIIIRTLNLIDCSTNFVSFAIIAIQTFILLRFRQFVPPAKFKYSPLEVSDNKLRQSNKHLVLRAGYRRKTLENETQPYSCSH